MSGDISDAHLLLRDKLKKLHQHVDGLLESGKRRFRSEPMGLVRNEPTEEHVEAKSVENAPVITENTEEPFSSSDEEDSEEDVEKLADIFVTSLRTHAAELSTSCAVLEEGEQRTMEDLDKLEESLNASWKPNLGLPVKPSQLPPKVHKGEPTLVDGLLVPPKDARKLNKLARKQIPDTAGTKWFNMPAKTLTPELKRDLQLLKMRGALNPKRHYKREKPSKNLPKYFQIGTVVEAPGEFYSSRLTRKERKISFAEELLADPNVNAFRKRKHHEIIQQKQAAGRRKKERLSNKRRKKNA